MLINYYLFCYLYLLHHLILFSRENVMREKFQLDKNLEMSRPLMISKTGGWGCRALATALWTGILSLPSIFLSSCSFTSLACDLPISFSLFAIILIFFIISQHLCLRQNEAELEEAGHQGDLDFRHFAVTI